ncbi:hypothetical protein [Microtetraspora malaysiensis]|uniref:hypothetical protein n=1 Tax=Microtetraspora malaysiensis TaxID=161358 RepID=UPI00082B9F15|nr:hypothetical protein [Microtetraspora malaysiensis]
MVTRWSPSVMARYWRDDQTLYGRRIDATLTGMYDENLVGLWDSGPYDLGSMETSWLGFLPDGRGWSAWANLAGGMDIGRFRWRCPKPESVELHYEWQAAGGWQGTEDSLRFSSIDSQGSDDEVLNTGYTIRLDVTRAASEPFTALHLEKPVQFCSTYALIRRELSLEDDPVHHLAPWQ